MRVRTNKNKCVLFKVRIIVWCLRSSSFHPAVVTPRGTLPHVSDAIYSVVRHEANKKKFTPFHAYLI